jgi:hypothetical protein
MSREAMKHTPGPWEVADLPHSIVVRTESPNKTPYGASRYAAIGGFDRTDPDQFAEAIANARLIAAAPDLLEALQEATSALEWRWERVANRAAPVHETAIQEAYNQARAAIAKATGEKS